MLNQPNSLHSVDLNGNVEEKFATILREIPFVSVSEVTREPSIGPTGGPDLIVKINVGNTPWTLICEAKHNTQLRHVRSAIYQLHHHLDRIPGQRTYAVLLGPYISPDAASLLRKESIGFADLAGNCFLSFDKVHIERSGARNPHASSRRQRSLFAPKSARVLTALLQDPKRAWRSIDLAAAAQVSQGQISNVKKALLDREWATTDSGRLRISRPDAVLDAWRAAYEKRTSKRSRCYTPLHGEALDTAIRAALEPVKADALAVLSSFSAARWLAPFARTSTTYFYANAAGENRLREALKLETVARGENVIVEVPRDEGVFSARVEAAPGILVTNPIQTYLDLAASGERGLEAAEHLRSIKITPAWSQVA